MQVSKIYGTPPTVSEQLSVTRKRSASLIVWWALFGMLCTCWGGTMYTHYNLVTYNSFGITWEWFEAIFGLTYTYIIVFLWTWLSVFCRACSPDRYIVFKNIVSTTLTVACLSIAAHITELEDAHPEYNKYQTGIMLLTAVQFFLSLGFSLLLSLYNGNIPEFCGQSFYRVDSTGIEQLDDVSSNSSFSV